MSTSSEIVGESSEKSFIFKEVTWKIPDVFSMPKFVDYAVESPLFYFANATWCLEMFPNGQSSDDSDGCVNIWIRRLWSAAPEHTTVFYKIYFQTRRGKEFQSFSGEFNNTDSVDGITDYLKLSELETEQNFIAPNGTVTIVCQMRRKRMRTKRNTSVEAYCQTEPSHSADSADKEVRHGYKVLRDFKELLLSEKDCDVTICIKGQDFQAHRTILLARSSVIASMFRNDMKEKATGVVDVEDCDPVTFPDFLHYLYCGSVEKLSGENVFSLYTAADKYDVQDLKSECLEHMKNNLSVDTFCNTIMLSLKYSEKELLKLATDFFAENLTKIIVTVKWQAFIVENPIQGNELMIKALVPDKNNSA